MSQWHRDHEHHNFPSLMHRSPAMTDLDAATKVLAEALYRWGRPTYMDGRDHQYEDAQAILAALPEGWSLTRVDALNGAAPPQEYEDGFIKGFESGLKHGRAEAGLTKVDALNGAGDERDLVRDLLGSLEEAVRLEHEHHHTPAACTICRLLAVLRQTALSKEPRP